MLDGWIRVKHLPALQLSVLSLLERDVDLCVCEWMVRVCVRSWIDMHTQTTPHTPPHTHHRYLCEEAGDGAWVPPLQYRRHRVG